MSTLLLKVTRFVIATVLIVGSLLTQHALRSEQAGAMKATTSHRHDAVQVHGRYQAKDTNLI